MPFDACGGCDLKVGINSTDQELEIPFIGPNQFFSVSCYEIEEDRGIPVHDSWGVVAMGQLDTDGKRVAEEFMGTYRLEKTAGYTEGAAFEDNWAMNFDHDEESIFSDAPFTRLIDGTLWISNFAEWGIHNAWERDHTQFHCRFYVGAETFEPTSFVNYQDGGDFAVDFSGCYSQMEIKDLISEFGIAV